MRGHRYHICGLSYIQRSQRRTTVSFQFEGVMAVVMVQDIERALRFYRDLLGFTVQEEQEDWVFFQEGVGLKTAPEAGAEVRFEANAVVLTLIVKDVVAAYRELTERGVAFFLPPTTQNGLKIAVLRDTENNLIQLCNYPIWVCVSLLSNQYVVRWLLPVSGGVTSPEDEECDETAERPYDAKKARWEGHSSEE